MAVVRYYDRYKEIYKLVVTASQALSGDAAGQQFSMTWQRRVLFINAAMTVPLTQRASNRLKITGMLPNTSCRRTPATV